MKIIEGIKMLCKNAIEDDKYFDSADEAYEFIFENIQSFVDYANSILEIRKRTAFLMQCLEGQNFRDAYSKLDERRTFYHNKSIRALTQLDRLCNIYNIESICKNVDLSDRYAVHDWIGNFIFEIYFSDKIEKMSFNDIIESYYLLDKYFESFNEVYRKAILLNAQNKGKYNTGESKY